uniref:Uncharacterized protein n=1 Tax=viral metagenome TaxID=1070528 RepID=A0A6M3LRF4_9ZZZZ
MQLGTETGSLVNHVLSGTKGAPTPEVGMGATILMWSDRRAATIVRVRLFQTGPLKGKVRQVLVQEDKATRTDSNGQSDMQTYSYEPDTNAPIRVFTANRNQDGVFRGAGGTLRIGSRNHYYDFGF